MLYDKVFRFLPVCALCILFLVSGCTKKEDPETKPETSIPAPSPQQLALEKLNLKKSSFIQGNFTGNQEPEVIAVEAITEDIKEFIRLKVYTYTNEYQLTYTTEKVEGTGERFTLQAVKGELPYTHCLYTTGDYFIGRSSGEVFAYLLDVKTRSFYPAHLFFIGDKAKLYLPPVSQSEDVKKYFIAYFSKDFADPELSREDYKMPL